MVEIPCKFRVVALAARRAARGLERWRALSCRERWSISSISRLRSNDARVRVLAITYKSSETSDFVRLTSLCVH